MNFLHSRIRVLLFIILHFGCASILASQHLARKLLWIVQNCHYPETNQFLNLIFWLLNIISGVWIKMSSLLATRLYDTGGVIITRIFLSTVEIKSWEDVLKFNARSVELFEEHWDTPVKRKAINDAYNSYFTGEHSDEIY